VQINEKTNIVILPKQLEKLQSEQKEQELLPTIEEEKQNDSGKKVSAKECVCFCGREEEQKLQAIIQVPHSYEY
jgi:hypothetical protein